MPNALDAFLELEKEGKTNSEIISELQERGFSSQEINDAINQSRIKKEVVSGEEMQPSIMQTQPEMPVPVPIYSKKKKQREEPLQEFPVSQPAQPTEYQYAAVQQPQPVYDYSYNPYQPYQPQQQTAGTDVETIEEIAEEIVNEKMTELRGKIDEIIDFKQTVQAKIIDIDARVKRIEMNIDSLQAALISKVQEYSRDIKNLGSEMRAVEGAFSNILNPLVDNIKELNSITDKLKTKEKKSK